MRKLAAFVLAACGSNPGAPANATAQSACLNIAPMRLLVLEHGTEWEPISELRADGTIVHGKRGVIGGIGAEQLWDRDHQSVMWCAPDRTIQLKAQGPMAHFDASDRFIDNDGSVLFVGDDGVVHWIRGGKDILGNARFEGGYASAKRTAALVVMATLGAGRWSF